MEEEGGPTWGRILDVETRTSIQDTNRHIPRQAAAARLYADINAARPASRRWSLCCTAVAESRCMEEGEAQLG
jgi:hypothetical protein